jgi:hypothetical protein
MGAAHRLAIVASVAVFAGVVLIPWYSRPGDDVYGWNVNLLGQAISLAAFWLALAAGVMLLGCRRLGRSPVELHVLRAGALVGVLCAAELALHRHAGLGLYLAGAAGFTASVAGRRAASRRRPRRRRAPATAGLTRS